MPPVGLASTKIATGYVKKSPRSVVLCTMGQQAGQAFGQPKKQKIMGESCSSRKDDSDSLALHPQPTLCLNHGLGWALGFLPTQLVFSVKQRENFTARIKLLTTPFENGYLSTITRQFRITLDLIYIYIYTHQLDELIHRDGGLSHLSLSLSWWLNKRGGAHRKFQPISGVLSPVT